VPVCKILAHWDSEAKVWWAERPDVRGFVAEADTLDTLIADLHAVVPDLLVLNHGPDQLREVVQIAIVADRTETLQIA